MAKEKKSASSKRVKLNREYLKIKKGQKVICRYVKGSDFLQPCKRYDEDGNLLIDEATGQPVLQDATVMVFETPEGIKFQMFEDGGLKNIRPILEQNDFVEIEGEGMKDLDGGKKRCNSYSVYAVESST